MNYMMNSHRSVPHWLRENVPELREHLFGDAELSLCMAGSEIMVVTNHGELCRISGASVIGLRLTDADGGAGGEKICEVSEPVR